MIKGKLQGIFVIVSTFVFLLICIKFLPAGASQTDEDSMVITAIDLGAENTGEATMISDGKGNSILVDSGDRKTRAVFDWLDENGYKNKKFDTLVSHWHDDHAGNTAEIIENYNVGTVYIPPTDYIYETNEEYSDPEYYERIRPYAEEILEAASRRGTRIVYLEKGMEIDAGSVKGLILYCCGSPTSENWYDVQFINNQSSLIMFTGGGSKYLTGGDLQNQAEKRVLKSGQPLQADIFKISHHGYDRSNMEEFIEAVNPTYAYFTSNKATETSYMHEDIYDSVSRMNEISNVMSTRYNGTIRYVCKNGEITVHADRNTQEDLQILTDKVTGKTRRITLVFNDACPIHMTKKVIDTDKYYNRRIYSNEPAFQEDF